MKRRQFLMSAAGIPFYLPFLEGLLSREEAAAQTAGPAPFMIIFKNSVGQGYNFWQDAAGALSSESMANKSTSVLSPYASQLLFVKGCDHPIVNNSKCSHTLCCCQLLTGGPVDTSGDPGAEKATTQSLDYYIARKLQNQDPFTLWAADTKGKTPRISWNTAGKELSYHQSPFEAYRLLFPNGQPAPSTSAGTEAAADPSALLQNSINDVLRVQIEALKKSARLSAEDKLRLEQHLAAIRDAETKIGTAATEDRIDDAKKAKIDATEKIKDGGYAKRQDEMAKLHMDLIAIAANTGQKRVSTLAMGVCIDFNVYNIASNLGESYHQITHYQEFKGGKDPKGDDAERQKVISAHDVLFANTFKYLLDQLALRKYGDKNLIDFGCTMWLNDMGPGGYDSHNQRNLSHIVAGSVNGVLDTGKMIDMKGAKNNKFLVSIGAAMGMRNEAGTGPMDTFNSTAAAQKGLIPAMFKKVPV